MDWIYYITIPFITFFLTVFNFDKSISQKELNQQMNNIQIRMVEYYYKGDKVDEQYKEDIETEIRNTTLAVKNSRKIKKDNYNYFKTLGILYGYTNEIRDIDRNKHDCYYNFMEAIKTGEDENKTKLKLITEILTIKPYSEASLTFSIRMLESLIDTDINQDQEELYELLVKTYNSLGMIKDATKYAYQYYYLNKNTDMKLIERAYYPYYNYINFIDNKNEANIYRNQLTGYEINYDNGLEILSDLPYDTDKHDRLVSFLQIRTPKVKTYKLDSIYNDISIRVYRPEFTIDNWLIEMKMKGIELSEFNRMENDSIVFSKEFLHDIQTSEGEPFKGIITIIQGDKYYYLLQYTATKSTFYRNLKYFTNLENSFKIVEQKEYIKE